MPHVSFKLNNVGGSFSLERTTRRTKIDFSNCVWSRKEKVEVKMTFFVLFLVA